MPDPRKPKDPQDDFSAHTPMESKDLQHADMQNVRRWLRLAEQFIDSDQYHTDDPDGSESES